MNNEINKAKARFREQKYGAKKRGIDFLLTFEEWWDIWQKSGHWDKRGPYKGQYCMSRYGDLGPYVVGNVFIQLSSQNGRDGNIGKPCPEERKQRISEKNKGRKLSEETRQKMSLSQTGRTLSEETKNKLRGRTFSAESIKKRVETRKRNKIQNEYTGAKNEGQGLCLGDQAVPPKTISIFTGR